MCFLSHAITDLYSSSFNKRRFVVAVKASLLCLSTFRIGELCTIFRLLMGLVVHAITLILHFLVQLRGDALTILTLVPYVYLYTLLGTPKKNQLFYLIA